jgi:hypothetical protein
MKEEELLEPLVPSVLANLEHRHSYVRRNAVLAVNTIYKLPKGELLLADAPETIEKVRPFGGTAGRRDGGTDLMGCRGGAGLPAGGWREPGLAGAPRRPPGGQRAQV